MPHPRPASATAPHRARRGRGLRMALVATLMLSASGCTLFGIVKEAVNGPPPTPALFVLPDQVTVVLVDDPDNTLGNPRVPRTIATIALHHMRFHGAPQTAALVDAQQVARLEARMGDAWSATPIDDIGRSLNADQIVYASVTPLGLGTHRGDQAAIPSLRLDVKVIDAHTGERLWPPNTVSSANGHPLIVKADIIQRRRRLTGKETPDQTLDHLADAAGLALGQLFYDWVPPAPGRELER